MSALIRRADAHLQPSSSLGWLGLRFRLMEEAGEPMDIGFVRYTRDGGVVDEEWIKHESHDGVGGFTALLESRGATVRGMPMARTKRPFLLRRLVLLWRYLRTLRGLPMQWKTEPDWTIKGKWPAAAVAVVDVDTTAALEKRLRDAGASVTMGVLAALDQQASRLLLAEGSGRRWFVPVNLRTSSEKRYENVVSLLALRFDGGRTAAEAHALLKSFLVDDLHWGAGMAGQLLLRLGEERLRRRLQRFAPGRVSFGFVSNVGVFPDERTTLPRDDGDLSGPGGTWAIIPPVNRRAPLACVLLQYKGALGVSFKLHGCLRVDDDGVRALLARTMTDLVGERGVTVFSDPRTRA